MLPPSPASAIKVPHPSLMLIPSTPRRRRRRCRLRPSHALSPSALSSVDSSSSQLDSFTKYSGYVFQSAGASPADDLIDYEPSKISSIYRRKPLLLARRLFHIATTFGRWFALRYIDRLLDRSEQLFKVRASELRRILVELGPAFVKIAQAVSSRPDVIPPAYLEELSLLQDQISPFSTEFAFDLIEKELGVPIDVLFSEISPEPIAAASLGQVYQARLCSSGEVVAVKVQRPGVQAAISLDIFILRYLAGLIRRLGKFNTDLQAVVDEWASSLFREMDYRREARNGLKFRKLYGELPDVCVPYMYLDKTSRRVLIMEWVQGKKLSEVKDVYLVEVGVHCSLTQLLEYGFYHADPHPGNLLRTDDGKLAYLDFGMMGEFREDLRDGFIEACLHLVNRDFDALAKDFVTLGLLPPTVQKDQVTTAITGVFENAVNKGVRNISFGDLSGNLGRTMYKFKFQIPSYFSLVIRSLAVLEGIAISFDPHYKVLSSSYPWIARKVLTDSSPKLKSTLHALLYKGGNFRIDRLESLLSESLRARSEHSMGKRQDGKGDQRVLMKQLISFTLTEKGEFVREILLSEFVKGIDGLNILTLGSIISALPFTSFLVDKEDLMNLRSLHRLMLLVRGVQGNEALSSEIEDTQVDNYLEEATVVLNQLISIDAYVPIFSVVPELPPECQQQLLNMPVDVAQRLLSRVIARSVRCAIL